MTASPTDLDPRPGSDDAPADRVTPVAEPDWRRRPGFLRAFVFGTGAGVMAVEFGAQRLMAPFFGTSQLVWGTLIGLILIALSGGYALGGRLADRHPTPTLLGFIVLGAGVFIATLPSLAEPLLARMVQGVLYTPAGIVVSSFVGVAVLFVPPVAALGAASPFAVRLAIEDARTAGRRTGSLYAWSTAGSIVGTFASVFLTIPALGVRATLWLAAALLIALGALTIGRWPWSALLAVPLIGVVTAAPLLKSLPGVITEQETPYQFAQVYRLSNGDLALSVNDAAGIQSVYTTRRLTGMVFDAFLTVPFRFPLRRPLSALLIGMAAGTVPTLYAREVDPYRAPVRMTGVEIDPALTALGRRYFHLRPGAARVVNADGRVYLERTTRRFDLIIVDAYSNEIYIPFALATRNFFQLVRAHLARGGILALNVGSSSPNSALLQAFERTLRAVFPHISIAKTPGLYNYLVLAGARPLVPPRDRALPPYLRPVARVLDRTWREPNPGPGLVLTDDRAPVESLTDRMILDQLRSSLGGPG